MTPSPSPSHFLRLIRERNATPVRRFSPKRGSKKTRLPKALQEILSGLSSERTEAILELLGLGKEKSER